ncbi:meprin A subunit beta-like [Mytilus californianus]|uniref:meprin A subunit beta-like n=1 Tax=Mytilus californianus TaxID=6549 RepID=UPI00224675A1|nr:meprin A subunit beta-like [Mytilus californianus]
MSVPVTGVADNHPEEAGFFEGDIEIEPGEEPYLRNAVANHRLLWPHGVVPWTIDSIHSRQASHVQVFHDAMNEIMEKTKVNGKKCIDFQPRKAEHGYMQFTYGSGCHTPIGYHSTRRSDVTLGTGCLRKGTVMHEILHGLGFWHEQSRADRDNYVTVHWKNIQTSHARNFDKYQLGTQIDHLGMPYDYGSVMHYPAFAFAIDRHQMTLEPKQSGVTIGQRVRLSETDAKEIQILYGCIPRGSVGSFTSAPGATTQAPQVSHVSTPNPHITNQAATCSFDAGLCGWLQSTSDNIDWRTGKGSTPSRNTGPHADHSGTSGGHYLYLEASGQTNKNAIIVSPQYQPGTYCFSAWFNMYGHEMGYIYFELLIGSRKHAMRSYHGDHGDRWIHFQTQINVHGSHAFSFQIEGRTGTSYHSDLAIDDVSVTPGACSHG